MNRPSKDNDGVDLGAFSLEVLMIFICFLTPDTNSFLKSNSGKSFNNLLWHFYERDMK